MANEEQVNNQRSLNSETERTLSLEQQIIDLLASRRGIDSDLLSGQQDINNVLIDQVKNMNFEVVQRKQILDLSASVTKISNEAYSISKDQLGLTETNVSLAKSQEQLSQKQLLLSQQRNQLIQSINNGTATDSELNKDIADSIKQQVDQAQNLKNDLDVISGKSKEISSNFGVKSFSGLSEITNSIPGLKKFSEPFDNAAESARQQAVSNKETFGTTKKIDKESLKSLKTGKGLNADKIKSLGLEGKLIGKNGKLLTGNAASAKASALGITKTAGKSMSPLAAGLKSIGPALKKALGPVAILMELVKAFQFIDKTSGEIAKEMGVSAVEGRSLVRSSTEAAAEFGDIMVSSKDVVAAQRTLNKQLGTAVQFSGEFAAEFASISERTQLSGAAMALFASNAMVTGGTIKDQLANITATTMELNAQSGISLSFKEVQEGIAKASKSALLSAGRNTKEIANQVYQAKLLGVEQSKVEGIADSLLDFEGSISKELEAELLLGKDLNLEKARQAALDNDLATVASEITKQVGSAAEFGEMNRIEQQAIAAAVGMTKEELAEALFNQENLLAVQKAGFKDVSAAQEAYNKALEEGNLTQELRNDLTEAGVLAQFESVTAQEKLGAVTDKLQDLFVSLMEPLMPIFDVLMQIVDAAITPLMKALSPILQMFGDLLGAILTPIAQLLSGMIMPIFKAFLEPINQLMGAFSEIKETLGGIFGESEGLGNIFENIGQILGAVLLIPMRGVMFTISLITEQLQGMGEIFGGLGQIIGGDFMGGIKSIGKGLVRLLIAPFQAMLDVGLAVINSLIDAANLIPGVDIGNISGVNIADSVFGEEEEAETSTATPETAAPTVGLATGGIVTSPTTALIGEGGEPEAVVPLSRASSLGFGGGNEKTVQLLERLVAAVERGGVVELDGNKVGTALGLVSYKTQ